MERDFTTKKPEDWPTPEQIWDYSQNVLELYEHHQNVTTPAQLEEHVRLAITSFNEAQASFGAPVFEGTVESVVAYYKEMEDVGSE